MGKNRFTAEEKIGMVEQHLREGKGNQWISERYGVSPKTLCDWIEKYKVHVAGLEYCLKNREKLMNEYCKGNVKYITFNDDGIKEITSPKIFYKDKKED